MSKQEVNAYILGTDREELYRLGLQHQVWATEAQTGWKKAGFTAGQHLLDLGCGPGFCTKELAFIAGPRGKVVGIDKSEAYIQYLQELSQLHGLNVEAIATDFNEMHLAANSFDGMYCRWALAWLPNPKEILSKVFHSLKKGGKMVIHEYYDWSTHQLEPSHPVLSKAIAAALQSFKEQEGDIDVGRELPRMLEELGMNVTSIRPMAKMARPSDISWNWPKSFYQAYFPKLADTGYLTNEEVQAALKAINELEQHPTTTLLCPILVEVIAEKV